MTEKDPEQDQEAPDDGLFILSYRPQAKPNNEPSNAKNDYSRGVFYATAIATGLQAALLIAACVVGCIYWGQLEAMRKSNEYLRQSIEDVDRNFQIQQQPWVHVNAIRKRGEFSATTPGTIEISVKNSGDTPALGFKSVVTTRMARKGTLPNFKHAAKEQGSLGVLTPGMEFVIDYPLKTTRPDIPPETFNKTHDIVVFGYFAYADTFGGRYCSIFCAIGQPFAGKTHFHGCPQHNDIQKLEEGQHCPPSPEGAATESASKVAKP